MAKKVYIVTWGHYSDYSIRAVFSNKAVAERYIEEGGGDDFIELPLNAQSGYVKKDVYNCQICTNDPGSLRAEYVTSAMVKPGTRTVPEHHNEPAGYIQVGSLVSAAHARKLATEARQEFLRNGGNKPTP